MKEYILSLLCVGIICSVSVAVAHEGTKSSVRMATGLILLLTMITPVLGIADFFSEGALRLPDIEQSQHTGGYAEVAEQAFEEGICEAVCESFAVERGDVSADCRGFDFESMRAAEIYIELRGGAVLADYRAIADYAARNFTEDGRCYVDFGEG